MNDHVMQKKIAALLALACIAIAAAWGSAGASAADNAIVTIVLPADARTFGAGPGQSVAQANCTICHAADYVYMQPPLTADQWRAEVIKMQHAFGAPISDDAVETLVAYLVSQNGKK